MSNGPVIWRPGLSCKQASRSFDGVSRVNGPQRCACFVAAALYLFCVILFRCLEGCVKPESCHHPHGR
jgi:hypothetical protein